jgi:hypothetical protein
MLAEFEKQKQERALIHQESRLTMILSLSMLASIVAFTLIAYLFGSNRPPVKAVNNVWNVFSVASVMLIIIMLAVRKTIYFSARLVEEDFTLAALLRRWRTIDIALLGFAEVIAVMGLVISLMGMPFARTFHFFVGAFLLTMINMPISFKVKDKIRTFEKYAGRQIL